MSVVSASGSHKVAKYYSPGQVIASSTSADAARGYWTSRPSAERKSRPARGGPPRPKQAADISPSASRVEVSRRMARPMIMKLNRTPGCTNAHKTRMLFTRGFIIPPLRGYRTQKTTGINYFTTCTKTANCNLMPEKALRTGIGNTDRMKFIEREPNWTAPI